MKKIITLLVILAIFATSAFAVPVSGVDSLNAIQTDTAEMSGNQTETAPELFSAVDELDALFADVQAVALTDTEASEIEGAGPVGAFFGAIVGGAVGGAAGAVGGAVSGGLMGFCLPF
jgi:hypothetical protein